jgi:hypothetical protein
MSTEKLDLFPFLAELNRRNMGAYESLTDEAKKQASPLVIMRWLSGTNDPAQIIRLNSIVNPYVFNLVQEKTLLFKLMSAACTGKNRANWIKGPSGTNVSLAIQAVQSQFQVSSREAKEYLDLLTPENIIQFAEEAGWDKDQIKKLQQEMEKTDGSRSFTPKLGKQKN